MQITLHAIAAFVASAILVAAAPAPSQLEARYSSVVKWDATYDNGGQQFNTVSCSDGRYGLRDKNWRGRGARGTFGAVPYFEQGRGGWGVAASPEVAGWGSQNCGKCYKIIYGQRQAWVVAVDAGRGSWNIGRNVLDYLTDGKATQYGNINADIQPFTCPQYWNP